MTPNDLLYSAIIKEASSCSMGEEIQRHNQIMCRVKDFETLYPNWDFSNPSPQGSGNTAEEGTEE